MHADVAVSEEKPPADADTPLAFSMEGSETQPPSPLIARYWSPGWNSVQALNKLQREAGGDLPDSGTGIRLVEPKKQGERGYFPAEPAKASPETDGFTAPNHHIFGSEELSSYSPSIEAREKAKQL